MNLGLKMDFKAVLDFFEGSVFSEEYVGDLSVFQQRLQALDLQLAKEAVSSDQLAWVKLLHVLYSTLTGNLTKAYEFLRELSLIQDPSSSTKVRIAVYEAFCLSLRRYPPILRFRPDLGGTTATFRNLELGLEDKFQKFSNYLGICINSNQPFYRFEAQIIQFLLVSSLPLWNDAFRLHPLYAKGPWGAPKASLRKNIAQRAQLFKIHRNHAVSTEMCQLNNYLARLEVEIEFGQSAYPSQMVEVLKRQYQTAGDKHNLGILKMLEADNILSPPFSSPIALNLILVEFFQPGFSVGVWDTLEAQIKLGDVQKAGNLYQEAFDFFSNNPSPRGQATILVRQGCVEHLQVAFGTILPEEKIRKCEVARQKFRDALYLFELDEAHTQIVRGHQILLEISTGNYDKILERAADIGRWGRDASNEIISRFVGTMILRFGRRQMLDFSRNDIALRSYKCAQACFRGVDDRFGLFRALIAELHILNSMNDHLAARSLVDGTKELFLELINYLNKMIIDNPNSRSAISALKSDMIIITNDIIGLAYYSVRDVVALESWRHQIQDIKRHSSAKFEARNDSRFDNYIFENNRSGSSWMSVFSRGLEFISGGLNQHEGLSSLIPRLIRFLWKEREPKLSFLERVEQSHENFEKYLIANLGWQEALHRLDVDAAEACLTTYLLEVPPPDKQSYSPNYGAVFAAAELGDLEKARRILRSWLRVVTLDRFIGPPKSNAAARDQVLTRERILNNSIGLENILAGCVTVQDWELGHEAIQKIKTEQPEFLTAEAESSTGDLWKRLAQVGAIQEYSDESMDAFSTYLQALQLAVKSRDFICNRNARRGIFSAAPFGEMLAGLARICIHAGKQGVPIAVLQNFNHKHPLGISWEEHALLFLEQVKARTLFEGLLSGPPVSAVSDEKAIRDQKRMLRMTLLALNKKNKGIVAEDGDEDGPLDPNERTERQEAELATLNAEIGNHDEELGPSGNVLPTSDSIADPKMLYAAIEDDELVISIDFSSHGFTLFGISSIGIEYVEHTEKLEIEIRRLVVRTLKCIDTNTAQSAVDAKSFLKGLSDELILPLADFLRGKKHVIFIASQPMSSFPFSTILLDDEPLFLQKAVSHASSLGTLRQLRSRESSNNMVCSAEHPISVCTIAKSTTPSSLGDEPPQEDLLFLAAIEAMIIARTFSSWPLEGNTITRSDFTDILQSGDPNSPQTLSRTRILHICTHGEYNSSHPSLSYISLAEKMRVLDIAHAKPRRQNDRLALIVFSACRSGMGQATMNNDVLGFAHALLETTCTAYLGALWYIDDRASMLLMTTFYRLLASKVSVNPMAPIKLAVLWQEAQKTLYQLDKNGAREMIMGLISILEHARNDGLDPETYVMKWEQMLLDVLKDIESGELDLRHPFYWASFMLLGNGGMLIHRTI